MLGNISSCRAKGGKKARKNRRKTRQYLKRNFKMKLHGRITMKFSNFLIDDPERKINRKMGEIIKGRKKKKILDGKKSKRRQTEKSHSIIISDKCFSTFFSENLKHQINFLITSLSVKDKTSILGEFSLAILAFRK